VAFRIKALSAMEIVDSRSRPTLQVSARLEGGAVGDAGVPSGESIGPHEAVPLRDGDPDRFEGNGVLQACSHVEGPISAALLDRTWETLAEVDAALCDLDPAPDKSGLGANAVVGVSTALARALATEAGTPLFSWLPGVGSPRRLPVPAFVVMEGGRHADSPQAFQDFMICPVGARTMTEALQAGADVYAALKQRLALHAQSSATGDQGGFAATLATPELAIRQVIGAITDAGYPAGPDGIVVSLDVAAGQFRQPDGTYLVNDECLTSGDMVARYVELVEAYPVWGLEDPLAEQDEAGWRALVDQIGERVRLVGDEIFGTKAALIRTRADLATAALLAPTQVGTITQTLEAVSACREAGLATVVSDRCGETMDSFIVDLAVACGADQIRAGSPGRRESIAKYNRLADIAAADPSLRMD